MWFLGSVQFWAMGILSVKRASPSMSLSLRHFGFLDSGDHRPVYTCVCAEYFDACMGRSKLGALLFASCTGHHVTSDLASSLLGCYFLTSLNCGLTTGWISV